MINVDAVQIDGNTFCKIELIPVTQKEKTFYLAKLPARLLLDIYTVEPAEYDSNKEAALAATFPDDRDYFQYRLDVERKRAQSREFERKLSPERVAEIRDFLDEKEYALFPNTVIVTCELINEARGIAPGTSIEDIRDLIDDSVAGLCFLEEPNETDNRTFLYVPRRKGSILVIDGQHRIRGLEKAHDEVIQNYEILVSFIIGFSRSVVAELFYTINYTQRSVNKSLLYHLMGEFSRELDKITFMHETVRTLNEVEKSPFHKRIKMLGTVEATLPRPERERMTISQAFLIDYLVGTISEDRRTRVYPPIFLY